MEKPIALFSSVLFLQLVQRWRCLSWLGRPERSGYAGAHCRACVTGARPPVNWNSLKSCKCSSGASSYSSRNEGSTPSRGNCQTTAQLERRWGEVLAGSFIQSASEKPHVLKTLPSVLWRLFDSRVLLLQCKAKKDWWPGRFFCLEAISRLQR